MICSPGTLRLLRIYIDPSEPLVSVAADAGLEVLEAPAPLILGAPLGGTVEGREGLLAGSDEPAHDVPVIPLRTGVLEISLHADA